jgi:hypothetical protein
MSEEQQQPKKLSKAQKARVSSFWLKILLLSLFLGKESGNREKTGTKSSA